MLPITNPNSLPLLKRLLETNTPSTVPSKRYRPSYKWAVPRREVPLHYTYYSPIPKEALMPQLEKHKDPNEEDGYVSQFDKKWAMNKKGARMGLETKRSTVLQKSKRWSRWSPR